MTKRKQVGIEQRMIGNPAVMLATYRAVPARTVANLLQVLRSPAFKAAVRFDTFRQRVEVDPKRLPYPAKSGDTEPREWRDTDDTDLAGFAQQRYDLLVSGAQCKEAIERYSRSFEYHPLRDYFDSLKWDGVERLATAFSRYLGAEDCEYLRGITRCWLTSVVARTYCPGAQVDYMVVLVGNQGAGKSQMLRALIGDEYFAEGFADIGSKDAIVEIQGRAIVCFDELASFRGTAAIESVKTFLTRRQDVVRLPYARRACTLPRCGVFCGTTNDLDFLVDMTGNRRFWPIIVRLINLELVRAERDQLWAEAVHLYKSGAQWWPGKELSELCETAQEVHREVHPWESSICDNWDNAVRRTSPFGHELSSVVHIIKGDKTGMLTAVELRIVTKLLRKLGYEPRRISIDKKQVRRWIHAEAIASMVASTETAGDLACRLGASVRNFGDSS